ncbi:hypothetical protein [Streptomyces sp. NPDC089799]|uniref:hypothetical protein n=1 Tax=Streptomyces sp. NPDC089799 TaxID=3155066 RepID=UPI00342474A1
MTPCSGSTGRAGPGTARALLSVLSLAAVAAFATGCRNDPSPAWGYPELKATLESFAGALAEPCDRTAPESCTAGLDRTGTLAERAFDEVLGHGLLDDGYAEARSRADRARAARLAAAREARSRRDPQHPPFRRAVAEERRAYEHLLAELRRLRTAPPPGDGTDPV